MSTIQRSTRIVSRVSQWRTLRFGATTYSHQVRHATFGPTPSPPRLPEEEQKIFEELQRRSTGAFSQPREEPAAADAAIAINQADTAAAQGASTEMTLNAKIDASGKGEELHPHIRRGAPPEFEGDKNPKTGEVGGPKNEPLRWGAGGDYSFNGRVTDF